MMKITSLSLAVVALFAASSFAGMPPHRRVKVGTAQQQQQQAKSWSYYQDLLEDALDDYKDASSDCREATKEYDHVAFSGGTQGDLGAKRSRLSTKKEQECRKVNVANQSISSAGGKALDFLEDEADAAKGDAAKLKEIESRRKWVNDKTSGHHLASTIRRAKHGN
jgi:hypothetical protein